MTSPFLPIRWMITTPDRADDPDIFPFLPMRQYVTAKTLVGPPCIEQKSVTNRSFRVQLSDVPMWKFTIGFNGLRCEPSFRERQRMEGFFASHMGRFGTFYYFDREDNSVGTTIIGTGDGNRTTFQLMRNIGESTSYTSLEPVYVVSGIPAVTINGVATTDYAIGSFGSITFGTAPAIGAVVAWSGNFMYLCHFSDDEMTLKQLMKNLWANDGINFESWIPL